MTPRSPLVWAVLLAGLAPAAAPGQAPPAAAVDAVVRDALTQWQVPGLALAVVRDDRVVYLKGFGVKEVGKAGAVTADTVFPLASCTKSLTALAVGMVVDDGAAGWDDPVRRHLPSFHLADPLADANVTLRDLLSHRTGVGGHDVLWYYAPWGLEERIRKLALVAPAHSFRSRFEYQTILFGAAGLAAGRAAGTPWEDLLARRVLGPLGMKTASPTFPADPARIDLATGHHKDKGEVAVVPRYPLDRPDPAGSAHASARDLARFLRFQLGDGTWEGRRLLAAENLHEPHQPQVVIRVEGFTRVMNPDTHFLTYGMGWIVQDYRGKKVLMHGGAIDGFRAHLTLVPEARLGVALLSNLDRTYVNLAISNRVVDLCLGLPDRDWSTYYLDVLTEGARAERERARQLRANKGAPPPLPLAAYAGAYHDKAYGTCEVTIKGGRLVWTWGNLRCPLEPLDGNTFLINRDPVLVDAPATFEVGPDGRVGALRALERVFRRAG